jgi:hypothetical protein
MLNILNSPHHADTVEYNCQVLFTWEMKEALKDLDLCCNFVSPRGLAKQIARVSQ